MNQTLENICEKLSKIIIKVESLSNFIEFAKDSAILQDPQNTEMYGMCDIFSDSVISLGKSIQEANEEINSVARAVSKI